MPQSKVGLMRSFDVGVTVIFISEEWERYVHAWNVQA